MVLDKEDNILARALAHDDREVFNRLFEKLYPKVKYFITGMCHDEEEAEKLTQNLFLRLWAKCDRLKRVDNISSYVFTMAYNESINFIRHSLTLTTLPIDSNVKEICGGADPQRDVEYKELIRKVYDKIDSMPVQRGGSHLCLAERAPQAYPPAFHLWPLPVTQKGTASKVVLKNV